MSQNSVSSITRCILMLILLCSRQALADDWPQGLGPERDSVWRETGIVDSFPGDGPPVRWRRGIGGGYAGPAVADGRVFVADRLDPNQHVEKPKKTDSWTRVEIPGEERLLCLRESDGEILWEHRYDCPYSIAYNFAIGPRVTSIPEPTSDLELELNLRRTIAELRNANADLPSIQPVPIWERPHEAKRDRRNMERNLRWIITRLRDTDQRNPAAVAVLADAGVWHVGARSIVEALESAGIGCRVLDRSCLTEEHLKPFKAIIVPGGWSVFQKAAAGKAGLDAIRSYVAAGGTYLGVCAGAYLAAKDVHWQGGAYPYPLKLFDGIAEGSLPAVAAWPKAGGVRVRVTAAGYRRGIGPAGESDFYYKGGPRFVGGTNVKVLAEYADGNAAIVARPFDKGEVVLTGVHFERPAPDIGGEDAPVPDVAGRLFQQLLFASSGDDQEREQESKGKRR